jgi:hypothetical protein
MPFVYLEHEMYWSRHKHSGGLSSGPWAREMAGNVHIRFETLHGNTETDLITAKSQRTWAYLRCDLNGSPNR